MERLARFSIKRRWLVIVAWLAFIVIATAAASAMGGDYKNDLTLPGTESQTVLQLLDDAGLTAQGGDNGTMVLNAKSGKIADYSSQVLPALQTACANTEFKISSISSPFGQLTCGSAGIPGTDPPAQTADEAAALISSTGTVGLVQISFDGLDTTSDQIEAVAADLGKVRSDALQVEFTGSAFSWLSAPSEGIPPMLLGFIAALIILALVFRTIGATLLPLATAAAALMSGMAMLGVLTNVMSVADFAPSLLDLMVIGVGVDYALFMVTRHRRNLLHGMSVNDSIALAVNTSGRAVMFAGATVCIALLGLCALGVSFLYGVAVGTALGVLLTMVASLTLLPALLSFLGLKILPRKQRKAIRAGAYIAPVNETRWYRWSGVVQRRSLVLGAVATGIIVMLSIPFLGIHLGSADQGNDSTASTTRKGYDLISDAFGKGFNSSLQLVVSGPNADDNAYLDKVSDTLRSTADVAADSVQIVPINDTLAMVSFKTITSPQDTKTNDVVKNLRDHALPPLYSKTDTHIYVYGVTAINIDFAKVLTAKMPLFFAAVIGLSFLLLLVAFRSIVIPLTAAVMNMITAAASFGAGVAIFQWSWGSELFGAGTGAPIEAFIPVMLFAILFGLSMDYQVFLVSRMHEEWMHRRDNSRAVRVGQGETGGIITAAAVIMIAVFGGFILGDERPLKVMGFGLAFGVFLDAFVLRTVLVPALMHKFGKANWWFPKWLEWIPRVNIEASEPAAQSTSVPRPERELVEVR
jgi:RND superfamily putative drug exporter